jgi:hypothetical protein
MLLRIIATICVIGALLLAPYWLFIALLILACLLLPLYIEGALIALVHDAFFSAADGQFFGFRSLTFLIAVVSITLVYILRRTVRKRT